LSYHKEQLEGLAKIADNLATACIVADIVGGLVDHKLDWKIAVLLAVAFFCLVFIGFIFREGD